MLKIYTVVSYVSIDGAEWRSVGYAGYCCTDEDRDVKIILDNASFEEVREYNNAHFLDGVWNISTFWRNKPAIAIKYRDAWDDVVYKNFNTMSYKNVYTEDKNVSLEWLMKHLTADQTIQYLKERGITACPMNF
jgi:KaiC/GvpD/RAD55 family RecA-like ATPase